MPVQRISHTPPSTLRRYEALIAITILALHAMRKPWCSAYPGRPDSPLLAPSMKHLHS